MASPFRYFRKHQKVFLAIAAVVAMFVFVIGDFVTGFIRQSGGGRQNPHTTVAEWDGGSLTGRELEMLAHRRYFVSSCLERLRMLGAQQILAEGGTPMMPAVPNFVLPENSTAREVRVGVVTSRILAEQAKKAGISVSDEMINTYLKELSFRRVSDSDLVRVLQQVGQGDPNALIDQLFAGLRELLLGNTYFSTYSADIRNILPEVRWQDWRRVNDRIALEVGTLPVSDFVSEVPEPTETELEAFYDQHKQRVKDAFHVVMGRELPSPEPGFKEPRRVKIQYILGDVSVWKDKFRDTITDEEIADYYERNKRTQFVKTGSTTSAFDENLFSPRFNSEEEPAQESAQEPSDERAVDESEGEETEEAAEHRERGDDVNAPVQGEDGGEVAEPESTEASSPSEDPVEPSSDDSKAEGEDLQSGSADPAGSESGAIPRRGPFRLAAFQNDEKPQQDGGPTEQRESASEDEGTGSDDQITREVDSHASTETGADEGESAESANGDEDQQETAKTAETEEEEDVEYVPLEEVSDSIRDKLAGDKAVVELKKVINRINGELQTEYTQYGLKVVEARSEGDEVPAPPESLTNFKQRAAEAGLTSEETVLLTFQELADTFVGRSVDYQSQNQTTTQAVFLTKQLYQPFIAQDLDANWYVIEKVEDVPERIPELADIRSEVVTAWKNQEAAKLALQKAEDLAKSVQNAGGTIAGYFTGKPYEVVTTDLFSWLTFGSTPVEMQRGPKLGEAPPLESVGPEFMTKAFDLQDDEVAAMLNYEHSKAYVMRVDRREHTEPELQELFLSEANTWYGAQVLAFARVQNQHREVLEELTSRVGLNLEKLEEFLNPENEE